MFYTLPSSESLIREDRFDLVEESENSGTHFWRILGAVVSRKAINAADLIDQLETIAITLRGTAKDCDYEFLRRFMDRWTSTEKGGQFFSMVWPKLVDLALEMPTLLPELCVLSKEHDQRQIMLSRRRVACLVVHQFLGSLTSPPWETDSCVDFRIWLSSSGGHVGAKEAYLTALFTYFERVVEGGRGNVSDDLITFTLRTFGEDDQAVSRAEDSVLLPMTVVYEANPTTEPPYLGLPDGACVISANKNVGFGSTGTQEEMHVGSSPECCPIVLLTPPLGDKDVLIVQGCEAMISMTGHGREARLDKVLPQPTISQERDLETLHWDKRTMLFMDALELDMCDPPDGAIPDLLPGFIDRELIKAYTAFSSSLDSYGTRYSHIVTGLWGCGAFGGDGEIKTLIQWCAASMAGVPLRFVCAGRNQCAFATMLEKVVECGMERKWRVRDVLGMLRGTRPEDEEAKGVFNVILGSLNSSHEDAE